MSGPLDHNDRFLRGVFRKFLFPTIVSVLGGTVNTLVDSAIVGRLLGPQALAAINLCGPIFLLCYTVGSLIGAGGGLLCAALLGKDQAEDSQKVYSLAVTLEIVCSLALMFAGLLFLGPVLDLLGVDAALRPMAREYARVAFWGAPVKCLLYIPFNFLRLDGKPGAISVILLVMTGCNGVLDVVFILLGWGMAGASLASVLATTLAVAIGFCVLRGGAFRLTSPKGSFPLLGELLTLGTPPALNNLLDMVRLLLLNRILMGVGGSPLVAVFTVVCSMSDFTLCMVSGVPQTAAPLIGMYGGERNNSSQRKLMQLQLRYGCVLVGAAAILIALLAGPICGLFGLAATGEALVALRLFALSLPFTLLCTVLISFYNASGRVWLANTLTFCRMFLFAVGPAVLLAPLGARAVWWFRPLAELLTLGVLVLILWRLKKRSPHLSSVLLLDDQLEKEGKVLDFSVKNDMAAVVEASERIGAFCEQNSFSPKLTMTVSLAIEEMLVILLQHCFQPGEDVSVDLRIYTLQGTTGLRIRSGGRPFNPLAYFEEHQDDPEFEDTLGIQLISKLAEVVRYQRIFGVNTLAILFEK